MNKTEYYCKGQVVILDQRTDSVVSNVLNEPLVFDKRFSAMEYLVENNDELLDSGKYLLLPVNYSIEYSEN